MILPFSFDYVLFMLPALALSLWAGFRLRSGFKKYSAVRTMGGMTGAQVAHEMLRRAGIHDVRVERTGGTLSDHYHPGKKIVALSGPVHDSSSVAAVSVAAHEVGHAIQHATGYSPLRLHSMLTPTAGIGSSLGLYMVIGGFFFSAAGLILAGIMLFSLAVLAQVVTLPVEFDASARAKSILLQQGFVAEREREGVSRVLNAAAMTYVAGAASSILTLLYFVTMLGGSDD